MKRITNALCILGIGVALAVILGAYVLPPAGATSREPFVSLSDCQAAYDGLDGQAWAMRSDLTESGRALALVEADRERLADEVTRLDRQATRQARVIERLRERLRR